MLYVHIAPLCRLLVTVFRHPFVLKDQIAPLVKLQNAQLSLIKYTSVTTKQTVYNCVCHAQITKLDDYPTGVSYYSNILSSMTDLEAVRLPSLTFKLSPSFVSSTWQLNLTQALLFRHGNCRFSYPQVRDQPKKYL